MTLLFVIARLSAGQRLEVEAQQVTAERVTRIVRAETLEAQNEALVNGVIVVGQGPERSTVWGQGRTLADHARGDAAGGCVTPAVRELP
jgi:hypothetical protein